MRKHHITNFLNPANSAITIANTPAAAIPAMVEIPSDRYGLMTIRTIARKMVNSAQRIVKVFCKVNGIAFLAPKNRSGASTAWTAAEVKAAPANPY
ncbi:MAG: hypothetical protein UX30_C0004G0039 [Candidatus Saccharibacteria bacterium GW2011_GWA2_46_10]|nr:MAG: hypothetical protein UX30_C0004G0039 [Candidatus Saccharibacteria bacterium GW2011_GWA2_46_10]